MAGQATRLAPLPGSKELLPIGFHMSDQGKRVKVVSHYLLEAFHKAAVRKVFLVLRQGKWDIPAYYGDGHAFGLELAYLLPRFPYGVPYTLDAAYPFVKDNYVAVGFPDIIYDPPDALSPLKARLEASGADIVLGVFPATAPERSDMVELDGTGSVRDILIKPAHTALSLSWGLAVWRPRFTEFLHSHLATLPRDEAEAQLGRVFLAAKAAGLSLEAVSFGEGAFFDVGTFEGLSRARARFGG